MPNKITVPHDKMSALKNDIQTWLEEQKLYGSARFGGREGVINHWLNGEDYCYYDQYNLQDEVNVNPLDTVFIFRDEKIATEFALRFA